MAQPPRRPMPGRGLVMAALLGLGLAAAVGCSPRVGGDGRTLAQHNDDLRRDNQELRQQIDETQKRLVLLESELRGYRSDATADAALPDAVLPVFAGLEFGRYSGPIDTDRDGIDNEVRLYVKPIDQRGRTLVVPGRARVQLLDLAGDEPTVLIEQVWEPADWDEAYRNGFTGDHYTLVVPLPADSASNAQTFTAQVELTEAIQGTVHRQQAAYAWRR